VKIGFVVDDHMQRPGGVQEYIRGLRKYLEAQGHRVVVFTGEGGIPEAGVIAVGLSLPLRGSGSSTSIPITLATPTQLRELLAREACDILHVMAPYSPTLSGRLLVRSQAAHVMTFLVALEPPWYLRGLGLLARTQWRSLRRFHAGIAISRAAEHSGQVLYRRPFAIIPVGVEVERFRPPPGLARSRSHRVTLVYIGRLEQRKGVAHLLRAVARLQRQAGGVRLLIGGNGPERETLERLAVELHLTDTEFLGYVPAENLPGLLHRADIFCAPATHAESFGIVLVEAMAAGLPIIAAANAGYREVLAAHPGNLLVPPGDDRALASGLQVLVDAPGHRLLLGERNLAAAQPYRWDIVGRAIEAIYQEALRRL
jgi:phosphatidylinositol alpha-mannosyltransferase